MNLSLAHAVMQAFDQGAPLDTIPFQELRVSLESERPAWTHFLAGPLVTRAAMSPTPGALDALMQEGLVPPAGEFRLTHIAMTESHVVQRKSVVRLLEQDIDALRSNPNPQVLRALQSYAQTDPVGQACRALGLTFDLHNTPVFSRVLLSKWARRKAARALRP